jgi:hypothetical protein
MEENEYRNTYQQFNQTRCVFEKAILSRRCGCHLSHKFCLAEREGIACHSKQHQQRCTRFLELVRDKAQFVLKLIRPGEPLPHAKEIRVQLGSLTGLAKTIQLSLKDNEIDDIDTLLSEAEQAYLNLDGLPFDAMIRAIKNARGRRPRRANKKS